MAQAFDGERVGEGMAFDWRDFAILVRHEEVLGGRLPCLLEKADLRAKQSALAQVWTRLVWRSSLDGHDAARLPGPDAFETLMDSLRWRAHH